MQYRVRRQFNNQTKDSDNAICGEGIEISGSKELFGKLVRENAGSLMAFLRASVKDYAAADDLFQETMLIAWSKFEDYDRDRPFGAWLRGISRRLVLAHYRKSAKELPIGNQRVIDYLDQRMDEIESQPGDTFDERIQPLRICVENLAERYRETVKLHYNSERSTQWIAEHLEITRDAVQKRLQRARFLLIKCLERKGVLASKG